MLAKDLNYLSLMGKFLYLHNEPVTEEEQRWSLLVDRSLQLSYLCHYHYLNPIKSFFFFFSMGNLLLEEQSPHAPCETPSMANSHGALANSSPCP